MRLTCANKLFTYLLGQLRPRVAYVASDGLIWKLQSIQHSITGARRYDHITHVLRQLH